MKKKETQKNEQPTEENLVVKPVTIESIVNFQLGGFDPALTNLKNRRTHLKRNGVVDPKTDELIENAINFKSINILEPVAEFLVKHPAYPWFSKVKGIGNENIAKVVALINIRKANTVSALWKYAGYGVTDGVADRPIKNQKLHFNKELKTMCYRIGVALLKAHCRSKTGTKFGHFFESAYAYEVAEAGKRGLKIADIDKIPKGEENKYRNSLHVYKRAFRRMVKMFLSCLWIYWREAEGLSTRVPYSVEKLGHTKVILPAEMIDRKKPTRGKRVRK